MRIADLIRGDHVVIWDCEVCQGVGPVDLIAIERVKGGDYTPETIVGADQVRADGGEVHIVRLVDGQSTTAIIERSRR